MNRDGYKSSETRQRLLEAGGEIFAEQGFRNARIREICNRAGANLAAVNYHFGDKEGLYVAVLKYSHGCTTQIEPLISKTEDDKSPEERLRTFIRSFLFHILDKGRPAWHGKLIAREMIEPTKALDAMIKDQIQPLHQKINSIVKDLLKTSMGDKRIHYCSLSILGQCLYYYHCNAVICRLFTEQGYTHNDIEKIADHITRFSLGAVKEYRKKKTKGER